MKQILVFIDWYLPGYKAGGPIRSVANMVACLADTYNFFIVTRNTDYLEKIPYAGVEPDKWTELSENQHVYYLSKNKLSVRNIRNILKKTKADLVYVNGVYSFYFSILPLLLAKFLYLGKIIVAPRGMFSDQGLGVKSKKKKVFVFLTRLLRLYKSVFFHVTSDTEYSDIKHLHLKQKMIHLCQNFPPIMNRSEVKSIEKKPGKLKLISIARISPEKNTLFALECLKNYEYNGHIEFDLYGAIYDKTYWEECENCIKSLPENVKVNYKGEIDNSFILDTLSDYHFLFLPSKGENFGHSILESFIAGCPVIISNQTPWKNLEGESVGWDLSLNEPEAFSQKIQTALDLDLKNYLKMAQLTNNYANSQINKVELIKSYIELFG